MISFTFDTTNHVYMVGDERIPSITQMLKQCGLVDDRFFTEESSDRGVAVHTLTADYDLGALDPQDCTSPFKGYLLGHAAAMGILRPEILTVEVPRVSARYRFAGRIDRTARAYGQLAIVEIKSGGPEKAHNLQTALQAILASEEYSLPAEAWTRYGLYLKSSGKFKLERHDKPADFDEARRIIARCCK